MNQYDVYILVQWVADNNGNLGGIGRQEEKRLPGFEELNSRQMFWVSYAQMYCTKWTDNGVFKLLSEVSAQQLCVRNFIICSVEYIELTPKGQKLISLIGFSYSRGISHAWSGYE